MSEEIVQEEVAQEEIVEKSELELANEKIAFLEKELETTKNAYYKAYADTENTKKRLLQDAQNQKKYRIQDFLQQILPVLDTLDRSLLLESENEQFNQLKTGIVMMKDQLVSALQNEGVEEISAEGEFDPNVHQALLTEKVENLESNQIIEVLQKGYKLKDRVIRASLVKVSE